MVEFRENPTLTWMMTGGRDILGNGELTIGNTSIVISMVVNFGGYREIWILYKWNIAILLLSDKLT